MTHLANIYHLGIKEVFSLRRDKVMLFMILWAFSLAVYLAATGITHDLNNASIAIVDEDSSQLSRRLQQAFLAPHFQKPTAITLQEIDRGMDLRKFTFALVIPQHFQADVLRGRPPEIQLNIDATASMQAGIGALYIQNIITDEVMRYLGEEHTPAIALQVRYAFNPSLEGSWFISIMEMINNITMLSILLTGAALVREREHGTIEHLLAMPLTPFEIIMAKVWANSVMVLLAVMFCLLVVIQGVLQVPAQGSNTLFLVGTALYLFFCSALGVFLGTITRSMPQFGLLFVLVFLPMNILSGGETPIESQPIVLQSIMQLVPSTHFVSYAQAILYRGAGLDIVWPQFLSVFAIGSVLLWLATRNFRQSIMVKG